MKAIIIDDEKHARENLYSLLERFCPEIEILGIGTGVTEGLGLIEKLKPELVFLDVEMQDGTGFDLLKRVPQINFQVIFVTAHNHFALDAIKWSALDFLLKPVDPDELKQAVNKFQKVKQQQDQFDLLLEEKPQKEKIALPTSDGLLFVKVKSIVRLEAEGCYTHFKVMGGPDIMVSRTMKDYIEMLPPSSFFRVHKSHYINLNYLQKYSNRDGGAAIMENGDNVPVSRTHKDEFVSLIQKGL